MSWKGEKMRHQTARKGIKTKIVKPSSNPMINNHKVQSVINLMYQEEIDPEYVSPNFVMDFAYNRDIHLNSEEVVYISDKYN